jgi:CRP-like cAMP-binding protein
VEKRSNTNGETVTAVLGFIGVDETFGELSFLMGGGASASVVAIENVEACTIEASYMNRLFHGDLKHIRPGLAARLVGWLVG